MKKKVTKLSREAHDSLKGQQERFIEKFGRQPGPGDPLFFDPNYDVPTPLTESKLKRVLSEAARKGGLDVKKVLSAFGFREEEGATNDF